MEQLWTPDLALFYRLAYAPVVGVEAPIKADLQLYSSAFHSI